jgi:hypothetical protein
MRFSCEVVPMKTAPPSSEAAWQAFKSGTTLGQRGSEEGIILKDEEHRHGARITLERDGGAAPFSVTCGVHSLFVHTAFASDDERSGAGTVGIITGSVTDESS